MKGKIKGTMPPPPLKLDTAISVYKNLAQYFEAYEGWLLTGSEMDFRGMGSDESVQQVLFKVENEDERGYLFRAYQYILSRTIANIDPTHPLFWAAILSGFREFLRGFISGTRFELGQARK